MTKKKVIKEEQTSEETQVQEPEKPGQETPSNNDLEAEQIKIERKIAELKNNPALLTSATDKLLADWEKATQWDRRHRSDFIVEENGGSEIVNVLLLNMAERCLLKKEHAKLAPVDIFGEIKGNLCPPIKITPSKDILKTMDAHTTKDDIRPNLEGVYFDKENQKVVATDGMHLVCVPYRVTQETGIILSHEKTMKKIGTYLEENFPNYNAVIPKTRNHKTVLHIPTMLKKLHVISKITDMFPLQIGRFVFFMDVIEEEQTSEETQAPEKISIFDPRLVYKSMRTLLETGSRKITAYTEKPPYSPLLLEGNNSGVAVVMPISKTTKIIPKIAHMILYETGTQGEESEPKVGLFSNL